MSNIQVTFDMSPNNARSESSIVINPNNQTQIVTGSKKFKNFQTYDFTLATSYSTDGGQTWHPSADLQITGWDCLSDPALAWDDVGNVFLVGLPCNNPRSTSRSASLSTNLPTTDKHGARRTSSIATPATTSNGRPETAILPAPSTVVFTPYGMTDRICALPAPWTTALRGSVQVPE